MNYENRLLIPIISKEKINFYTSNKLQISTNYNRVVIGDSCKLCVKLVRTKIESKSQHISTNPFTEVYCV